MTTSIKAIALSIVNAEYAVARYSEGLANAASERDNNSALLRKTLIEDSKTKAGQKRMLEDMNSLYIEYIALDADSRKDNDSFKAYENIRVSMAQIKAKTGYTFSVNRKAKAVELKPFTAPESKPEAAPVSADLSPVKDKAESVSLREKGKPITQAEANARVKGFDPQVRLNELIADVGVDHLAAMLAKNASFKEAFIKVLEPSKPAKVTVVRKAH